MNGAWIVFWDFKRYEKHWPEFRIFEHTPSQVILLLHLSLWIVLLYYFHHLKIYPFFRDVDHSFSAKKNTTPNRLCCLLSAAILLPWFAEPLCIWNWDNRISALWHLGYFLWVFEMFLRFSYVFVSNFDRFVYKLDHIRFITNTEKIYWLINKFLTIDKLIYNFYHKFYKV